MKKPTPRKTVLMIGRKYGRLSVLCISESRKYYRRSTPMVVCKCECGVEKVFIAQRLRSGHTRSCGCLAAESRRNLRPNFVHGHSRTGSYLSWLGARTRCTDTTVPGYRLYGGRGIKMCDRWLNSVDNFIADMGERPPGMTLDRIDTNGDYSPENCRWADQTTQSRNRRNNRVISANGLTLCLAEWAELLGISYRTMRARLELGWDEVRAVTTPLSLKHSNPREVQS